MCSEMHANLVFNGGGAAGGGCDGPAVYSGGGSFFCRTLDVLSALLSLRSLSNMIDIYLQILVM